VLIDASLIQSSGRLKDDLIGQRLDATPALLLLKSYLQGLTRMRADQRQQLAEVASRHLLELVVIAADTARKEKREPSDLSEARLRIAIEYIGMHFRDPTLDEHAVAAAQGISVRYLQKLFETAGMRFSDHINRTRIAAARTIIEAKVGEVNVVDIALDSGFGDLSHFYRMFKRHTGATPLEFRRMVQRDQVKKK
jgi:AraC-like DNA-binding protein